MTWFRLYALTVFVVVCAGMLPSPGFAEKPPAEEGEIAYIVNDYRYEPGDSGGDPDTGLALCATRCNALSADSVDYMMGGGWEMRKIAVDRELTIPLGNPFMKGDCICTVDEFLARPGTRARAGTLPAGPKRE